MPDPEPSSAATNAFAIPAFLRFFISRITHSFAMAIMTTAVNWQIWEITHDAYYFIWVGLAVFLPVLFLVVPAGLAADRFDRKLVLALSVALEAVVALGFLLFSLGPQTHVWPIFLLLALVGVASAFGGPAAQSLVPNILTRDTLNHGIALNTMSWQFASIAGPALGGLLWLGGPLVTYGIALALSGASVLAVVFLGPVKQTHHENPDLGFMAVVQGFKVIWHEPIILGAISLDMFAVLLGGAVALMPIYADQILHMGALGNGLLRAAPGLGAVGVGLWLAKHGITKNAGLWLFAAVALSGLSVVIFGFSTTPWLSILMLMFYGAFDMVSVYVREILMQLWTPDKVRGRVNAVNNVFIGASNQLGEARAGLVAWLIGAVPAVVIGGFGTVAVAALWAAMFPKLRQTNHLNKAD